MSVRFTGAPAGIFLPRMMNDVGEVRELRAWFERQAAMHDEAIARLRRLAEIFPREANAFRQAAAGHARSKMEDVMVVDLIQRILAGRA